MRIRVTLGLTVSLLFCTLATLEVPELINLTDDTSNDYSLVLFTANKVTVAKDQRPFPIEKTPVVPVRFEHPRPTARFQPLGLTGPSHDRLHSLCVLRT
jgi:hypothetical protein